ncbi:hypothetical protein THOM_2453 [Trachipleistophora hominis]|uniref:Uncharacterized protein n=1 Tax=Trachipleistophora hominis TaxID=72359 RepID=L7JT88_TRAHO|nr:hypothetical protein THOM_2453 [Trachipleistophora hominis]
MHILFVLLHLLDTVTASYGRINENNLGQVNNSVNKNNTNSLPNLCLTFAFESVPSVSIMNTVQQLENGNLSCSSSKTPSTHKITSDNDKIGDDGSSYQPPVRIGRYRGSTKTCSVNLGIVF